MNVLTEDQFKDKIKDILIVQFSATWCGPCKALARTIESCKEDLTHPIYQMDIDKNAKLCSALSIRSVPTLIRFENGEEVKRLLGNRSSAELISFTT